MRNTFKNLSSSGAVITGAGILSGMYVHSTSSGTIKLWHGTSEANTGAPIGNTMTPAAGYHYLGDLDTSAGVYAGIANTIDVTFHIRVADI